MSDWSKVGENLVRHRAGTIYLRAKVNGKIKRVSLKTDDLRIAKLKRDVFLDKMRKAAVVHSGDKIRNLGDAIDTLKARTLARPDIRPVTAGYYREIFEILRQSLPVASQVRAWSASDAAGWWKGIAGRYAEQRANNALGMLKRLCRMLVEMGLRVDDPSAALRRVKIPQKMVSIPSREVIDALIADIRGRNKAHSEQAANFVEFLAFSGCRLGQAKALRWEHIEDNWILFPSGVHGTKGAKTRRLPVTAPLRAVLDRMRPGGGRKPEGPVFTLKRPHEALANACERLGIEHLRIHDLRHFFATFMLESGIDVKTVSGWLGHKDGGVLVLRTYGHLRDEHSLKSAQRIR